MDNSTTVAERQRHAMNPKYLGESLGYPPEYDVPSILCFVDKFSSHSTTKNTIYDE